MKAFLERDNGEYVCGECGKTSTIYFIKKMNVVIPIVTSVAVVIFILYFLLGNPAKLWGTALEALPFVLFFLSTPFFFRLVPMNMEHKKTTDRKNTTNEIYSSSKMNIKSGAQSEKRRDGYNRVNDRGGRNTGRYGGIDDRTGARYRQTESGTRTRTDYGTRTRTDSGARTRTESGNRAGSGTRQTGYKGGRYSDKGNGKRYY